MTIKWLTIEQIAVYLQVSKEKVYKLCQRGKMPASKLGGQWRFERVEIDKIVASWTLREFPEAHQQVNYDSRAQ